ncbi:transposase [Nocardia amamiensis]|uniref:Transposase n=1 Tax=Nocardia amamiensis TaxID=404578 RepID=A0ABS0CQU6_9NOCA|nr:transposase [Nocardia amamiensis]MBF6298990.1 transposase [Nocardia amamiensis]
MPVAVPLINAAKMSQLIVMDPDYPQYELLARALYAQFGNIYEYNLSEGQDAGFDGQEWTGELRIAVRQYLLHELPADVRNGLFRTKDSATTDVDVEERVDQLLQLEPWEVAFEVRNAAVAAVPTLRELIGHLDTWPSGEESADAIVWLEANSTMTEWRAVAEASNHDELQDILMGNHGRAVAPQDLVRVLSPPELLAAWQWQFGPAESDLTDDEWRLIESAIPPRKIGTRRGEIVFRPWKESQLAQRRRNLNGIRYKFAEGVRWTEVPPRYGDRLDQTWQNYAKSGFLVRVRDALQDNPDAIALVAWLDKVIADAPKKGTPRRALGVAA